MNPIQRPLDAILMVATTVAIVAATLWIQGGDADVPEPGSAASVGRAAETAINPFMSASRSPVDGEGAALPNVEPVPEVSLPDGTETESEWRAASSEAPDERPAPADWQEDAKTEDSPGEAPVQWVNEHDTFFAEADRVALIEETLNAEWPDPAWSDGVSSQIDTLLGSQELSGSELTGRTCGSTLCRVETRHRDADSMARYLDRFPLLIGWNANVFVKITHQSTGDHSVVYYLSRSGHRLPRIEP